MQGRNKEWIESEKENKFWKDIEIMKVRRWEKREKKLKKKNPGNKCLIRVCTKRISLDTLPWFWSCFPAPRSRHRQIHGIFPSSSRSRNGGGRPYSDQCKGPGSSRRCNGGRGSSPRAGCCPPSKLPAATRWFSSQEANPPRTVEQGGNR